jgi:hypothetical protein
MTIKQIPLHADEYYHDKVKKTTIALHHTAGSHRPDFSINGWETDKDKAGNVLKVGTAFVIGGTSTTDRNADWDGVIAQAFPADCWAHHWGLSQANNTLLNQSSIGIEICNYGPLKIGKDGQFYNYVNKPVPKDMVVKLPQTFRGYDYYHAYTPGQISALKELICAQANEHNIDVRVGIALAIRNLANPFEVNQAALKGMPGMWSHTNMRPDKFDITPQPAIIEMLLSL